MFYATQLRHMKKLSFVSPIHFSICQTNSQFLLQKGGLGFSALWLYGVEDLVVLCRAA